MKKIIENGYILAISATSADGIEITDEEYNAILSALRNRPESKDGFALMLKDGSLEWEFVELPPVEDEDIDDSEALDIILGGGSE